MHKARCLDGDAWASSPKSGSRPTVCRVCMPPPPKGVHTSAFSAVSLVAKPLVSFVSAPLIFIEGRCSRKRHCCSWCGEEVSGQTAG